MKMVGAKTVQESIFRELETGVNLQDDNIVFCKLKPADMAAR